MTRTRAETEELPAYREALALLLPALRRDADRLSDLRARRYGRLAQLAARVDAEVMIEVCAGRSDTLGLEPSTIKNFLKVAGLVGAMALAGCETAAGGVSLGGVCGAFSPISYSPLKDTQATKEQIKGHNAAGQAVCGWPK